MKAPIVFMSVAAAEMNLGDLFIRRTVTRAIRESGAQAVVYTGAMGQAYVDAFELPSTWGATASPREFLTQLLRACVRRRAVIIMAPAPAALDLKPTALMKRCGIALLLATARLLGNRVVVMGRAVRGAGRLALLSERLIACSSALYLARDHQTAKAIGGPAQLMPDLGFATIAKRFTPACDGSVPRNTVALSLRRMPNAEAAQALVRCMQSRGFIVITVTQVQEDEAVNGGIAHSCGIEHLGWPTGRAHLDQEALIAETYSRSVAVLSDRLHALIIGGRYGAIPVIIDRIGEDKLHATLDEYLKPQAVRLDIDGTAPGLDLDLSSNENQRLTRAFASAAAELDAQLVRFSQLLGGW